MRSISKTSKATCLSVGGIPKNSPLCVPENVFSVATLSPSAICSLISAEKSGNASHMYWKNRRPSSLLPDSPGPVRAVDEVVRYEFLTYFWLVAALELFD
jgi:hypothetical protein